MLNTPKPPFHALLSRSTLTVALGLCCALLIAGQASASTPTSFGAEGTGAGEFTMPSGIAVSEASQEIFIADRNDSRVDVFTGAGVFLRAWGWGVADGKAELQTCTTTCFAGVGGGGAGEFGETGAEGIAVDNSLGMSQGDVYVIDKNNNRVEKFTPSGEFLLMFGHEVNATTHGDVCDAGEACQAGVEVSGGAVAGPGEFVRLNGDSLAVDSAGEVYVGDENRIQRFSPDGVVEPAAQVSLPGSGFIEGLAVDSAGNLYVTSSGLLGVHKYSPIGTELQTPRDEQGGPSAIAVGPAGELFISDSQQMLAYSPTGTELSATFAEGGASALASDQTTASLYLVNQGAVKALTPATSGRPYIIPDSASVSQVQTTAAVLNATINAEGGEETAYHFEYGTSTTYGSNTPIELAGGEPFADQHVTAIITHLQPGTVYHFRLVATNKAGETTTGPDQSFETLPPVLVDRESASHVSSSSARLEVELNPLGQTTQFHFEYGTSSTYGNTVPIPDANAGAGLSDAQFSLVVQDLAPSTTYHYRVIAENALGRVEGPDQTFTTQDDDEPVASIDGRAWEMITPIDKHGVALEAIMHEGAVIQAAENGDAISYVAKAPITEDPQGNRSIAYSQVLSRRTNAGIWSTQDIATAHEQAAGLHPGFLSQYKLFSNDLSTGVVEPEGSTPLGEGASEPTPYRREENGQYTPLVTAANVPTGVKFGGEERGLGNFVGGVHFVTATPSQSHILLRSPQALTAGFASNFKPNNNLENLYEWSEGQLQLVSVLPNKTPTSEEGIPAAVGNGNLSVRNAISDDGNRIVFEAGPGGATHLFVRDMVLGQSVQVDKPEGSIGVTAGSMSFQFASSDGSRVFFLDTSRLTVDATARSGQPDLYECEVTVISGTLGCALKDLSVDRNPGESADVLGGVMGADESGRYVYFTANGAFVPGAVHGDCPAEIGHGEVPTADLLCNLYMRDTVTQRARLVAVLSARDFHDWQVGGGGSADLETITSRVSPNGQFLAFMSQRPLTGFDNRDAASGERDEEVFEYALGAAALSCVSCANSGARPEGIFDSGAFPGLLVDRPTLWQGRWLAASVPGWTTVDGAHALYQSRYLSNSGRMFFNSATPLVPADSNGLEDVYEYEPAGIPGCGLPSGCVGLISSGQSGEETAFLDASGDGSDVFFLTSSRLSSSDTDDSYDIYDAHVCSESAPCAAEAATTPPPCGTADACRAAPSPQPDLFGSPASQTFKGTGNATPTTVKPTAKAKSVTRTQKLAKALASCRKVKVKAKHSACVKRVEKRYGPVRKKSKAKARK
jgi:hypothetical protein